MTCSSPPIRWQARRLMSAGLASRPTVVTANVLVVAVPNDGPWLSLRDLALADVRIAAGAPSVPVGALTEIALELVQLQDPETAAALRSKIATQDPNVRIVLSRLELGEADAAFVYASDVEATEGLRLIALPLRTPPNEYDGGTDRGGRPRGGGSPGLAAGSAGAGDLPALRVPAQRRRGAGPVSRGLTLSLAVAGGAARAAAAAAARWPRLARAE